MEMGQALIPEPRARELRIRVLTAGVNRMDLLQRMGKYPVPPGASEVIGVEVAGIVDAVGPNCEGSFKIGDRVMALLSGGGYAEYATADERTAMHIPPGLSDVEAAGLPEVWLTAYQLLHFVGRLQPGDNVLIHGGASGVGLAAIQLATMHGASAFATAGSDEKCAAARSVGATDAFNYRTLDGKFAAALSNATRGHGADVILDCIGASYWEENFDALAEDGRWVVFGLMGGTKVDDPNALGKILRKRAAILGTTLRSRDIEYRARLVSDFEAATAPLFADGRLKMMKVDSTFPMDEVAAAHTRMGSNANIGKIVLIM